MRVDLSGQRFGRLTVCGLDSIRGNGETYWKCICDCGNFKIASRGNLKSGTTQSCGCLQKERASEAHKKTVRYDLTGDFGIGYTVNDNTQFLFDKEDFSKISPYSWFMNDQGYIVALNDDGRQIRMHRLVTDCQFEVDHRNRNRTDNRKENLRLANKQQNGMNRGCNKNNKLGVKGVSKINGRFYARIMKDGKTICLGGFSTLDEAHKARVDAEKMLFGEFAYEAR